MAYIKLTYAIDLESYEVYINKDKEAVISSVENENEFIMIPKSEWEHIKNFIDNQFNSLGND